MVKPTILILLFSLPMIVKGCNSNWVGDGYCDSTCNNRENKFDDGDCCEYSCTTKLRTYPCGSNGYDCKIPVTVPSWFSEDTKLCYKWRPDGDGGQCGAGEPRELCATVGSPTQYYRDDTDNRGGGCRMQWAIMYDSKSALGRVCNTHVVKTSLSGFDVTTWLQYLVLVSQMCSDRAMKPHCRCTAGRQCAWLCGCSAVL